MKILYKTNLSQLNSKEIHIKTALKRGLRQQRPSLFCSPLDNHSNLLGCDRRKSLRSKFL